MYKLLDHELYSVFRSVVGPKVVSYFEDLLGSLLHARPHLVAKTPQSVELQNGVDALTGLLVLELRHHHLGHGVGDFDGTKEKHGGWRRFKGVEVRNGWK